MILPDVNLLIYAYNSGDERHAAAKAWLAGLFDGASPFGLSWLTISAFLRIVTAAQFFGAGFSAIEALEIVEEWLEHPNVILLSPTSKHFQIFKEQVLASDIKGSNFTDAHIASLAIEHNATLATNDQDFRKFTSLKLIYPLKPSKK